MLPFLEFPDYSDNPEQIVVPNEAANLNTYFNPAIDFLKKIIFSENAPSIRQNRAFFPVELLLSRQNSLVLHFFKHLNC